MTKMKLLLLFIFALFVRSAPAQWIYKDSGTNKDLYDLHFPSSDIGYAVGDAGTIVKTTDAGETWSTLSINTTEMFHAVWFTNETTGFVAGDDHLFKTTNGGNTWTEVPLPLGDTFRDLFFLDAQNGFCAGGSGASIILKTTDGGETWTPKILPDVSPISSIHFATPQVGYAVGIAYSWAYLKTTDGGETWAEIPINSGTPHLSNLETVYFTEAGKGFIGGWYLSALIMTSNGGDSWSFVTDPDIPQLYAIHFPSASRGYAVGWNGQVFNTTDGGNTWDLQIYGDGSILYAVQFTDENTGYIAGYSGTILKTGNGGGVTAQSETDAPRASIKVYPNPTTGAIQLDLSAYANRAVRLEIYDVQGNRLNVQELDTVINGLVPFDLSAEPGGVYHIRVQSEGLPDVVKRIAIVQE